MTRPIVRWSLAACTASLVLASPVRAQTIFESNGRAAPQFVQYQLKAPVNETISEFTTPIFVVIPVSSTLTFDVGTAYAWARVQPNSGNSAQTSTINGLTDTQIRATLSLGTDFVVLTAGLNLPTGQETAGVDEQLAAFRIGNDFLSFPISNMGTGFGATGGVAVARPIGSWNLGVGGSVRQSSRYEPFIADGGARPRFQPGNEYRVRAGVDHPFGTGRFAIGLTYSKFGNDDLEGSIYNTGDRYIAQAGFNSSFAGASVVVNAWNLYRRSGTIFTGERTGPENIANMLVGVGFSTLSGVLEPTVELRSWTQQDLSASALATLGMRYTVERGGLSITPSAGYSVGRFAAVGGNADLSGYRAALAVRLGR
jgi:hypothetical protein